MNNSTLNCIDNKILGLEQNSKIRKESLLNKRTHPT